MKKAVLFLLSLAILPYAHAEKVVLGIGEQSVTRFSLVSQDHDPKNPLTSDYRIIFDGLDSAIIKTPDLDYVKVMPKAIKDSRAWDGCLVLQLTEDLELNECSHDGPTYWYLKSKSAQKTIELEVRVQGHLRIEQTSK
jgi:hypothetical protein